MKIENVSLGPILYEDLNKLMAWRNELMDNFRQWYQLNELNQAEWYEAVSKNDKHIMLGVYADVSFDVGGSRSSGVELLGIVGLTYVDWIRRKAEASIYLGPEYGGYGAGTEALKLIVEYGFNTVNLHRIYAEIYEYNDGSIKLFEKVGFTREGTLRDSNYRFGNYSDTIIYGLLKHEYVH